MPHQCVRCGAMYDDGSEVILKGCSSCGSRLFFYIKQERLNELKNFQSNLSDSDKKQIEEDILDLIGQEGIKDSSIVLDIEAIRVPKPGSYEIDIVRLFKGDPIIYKLEEGKYFIDVAESLKRAREKEKNND